LLGGALWPLHSSVTAHNCSHFPRFIPRFNGLVFLTTRFNGLVLSVVGNILIDSEAHVMTLSISRHRVMVCMLAFIEMSVRTCMRAYVVL